MGETGIEDDFRDFGLSTWMDWVMWARLQVEQEQVGGIAGRVGAQVWTCLLGAQKKLSSRRVDV